MSGHSDAQVSQVSVLAQVRSEIRGQHETAQYEISAARSAFHDVHLECAEEERRRTRALADCEADDTRDCDYLRKRLETATRVRVKVGLIVAEADRALASSSLTIRDRWESTSNWLLRVVAHIEGIGTAPDGTNGDTVMTGESSSRPTYAADTSAHDSRGKVVVAGLELAPDVERVRLVGVPVDPNLPEYDPPKASEMEDLEWAATTFKSVILPHIAQGGTKIQLREKDHASGNFSGLRRLEGAWDVYLGDEMPRVVIDGSGEVTGVDRGRHRILAAKNAGLTWIPMRTQRTDIQAGNS